MLWVNTILLVAAGLLLVPISVVCLQCFAWLLPRRYGACATAAEREPLVVLIPAHDEESGLEVTLKSVECQLRPGDRVVVVADNCSDRTAEVARRCRAEVIERHDATRRGKGYALNYGIEYLNSGESGPKWLVIVDADCALEPGALDALARQTMATHRPAQAVYLLDQPKGATNARSSFSALAFLVRNGVRPGGWRRLGMPCLLTGSGMAFPWEALCSVRLGSDHLVEDMQLGLDLAAAGWPPILCESSRVMGKLPADCEAAKTQRTRWEHGQISVLLSQVPRLTWTSVRTWNFAPMGLALDLAVPPLSLLVMLMIALMLVAGASALLLHTSWLPVELLLVGLATLFVAVSVGCAKFGRGLLPATILVNLPTYLLWKLPIYVGFIRHRQTEWVRTARPRAPVSQAEEANKNTHGVA